jgi:tetratricopeptide (TPR) repeat protein
VRVSPPQSVEADLDAHLYEGIALDLLEDHEGAIGHFEYVKNTAKALLELPTAAGNTSNGGAKKSASSAAVPATSESDPSKTIYKQQAAASGDAERKTHHDMYERGAYNEAIAHLRNLYQYEGIKRCIELIDQLTEGNKLDNIDDVRKASPIRVLALAVKADAIGCKTIPWRQVPDEDVFDATATDKSPRAKLLAVIKKCDQQVEAINNTLRQVLKEKLQEGLAAVAKETPDAEWDDIGLRQLEWAINNAEGDLNLYSVQSLDRQIAKQALATQDEYLDIREIRLLSSRGDAILREERQSRLQKALNAFRRCEQLLPAGVETLSNLGTLYLARSESGDLSRARRYFASAIALNPSYEYAYYKLAQTWEMDRRTEKVIETLKQLPKPPDIASFQKMYRQYFVQPKMENELAVPPKQAEAPKGASS